MTFLSDLARLREAATNDPHIGTYSELRKFLGNHAEAIEELVMVAGKRTSHRECEDSWYSCPKSDDGCADEIQGTECNCGADEMIAALEKLNRRE